ncbi:MAG: hypothetical protein ABW184_13585 [Sphingobium sp.]
MLQNGQTRLVAKGCALALAIASFSAPVAAQEQPVYSMDDEFRASVEALRLSFGAGDAAGTQQNAQALLARADQPFEKYAAAELMFQAATARWDVVAQRTALKAVLESGAAPPSRVPRLRAIAGILSLMVGENKDSIAQISQANGEGYASVPSQFALADAKFMRKDPAGGLTAVGQALTLQAQGGRRPETVEAAWYDRAIALAYQAKRFDLVANWTQAKLAIDASAPNWRSGLVNYMTGAVPGPDQSLDLYRLMAATDAIASERDWLAYSAVAVEKGYAAEGKAALDTGVKAGDLGAGDPAVVKSLTTLRPRATQALAAIPGLTAKAKTGTTGAAALTAADAQFAAAAYPKAVELYQLALTKGGVDLAHANTRLGVALARSGDPAGGKAALATVTDGPWAPVASFWNVWIDRQSSQLGAAQSATKPVS